ncbi:C-type lectin 37Da [Drosophila sechellia]|uniref:GM17342 n=1 Tax=Drosophila sechellia TaxID=7238 RepID=B4I5U5_DROSE|nr:C-type lectin 37Da [Drosophila sechellia]EDW55751.1 GM17342 [Drosophila sechellia]
MLMTVVQLLLVVAGIAPGFGYDKYTTHIQNGNPYNLTVDMTPFIKINASYYVFGQTRVNWYVAYENCRRLQSELVTFETAEEFDAIAAFLNARGDRSEHWTSGNDLGKTGTHYWFSNAQLVTIKRWAPKQPDNAGGREHCIHLGYIYNYSTEFQLNDRPCHDDASSLFKYICEAPKQETVSIVVWK